MKTLLAIAVFSAWVGISPRVVSAYLETVLEKRLADLTRKQLDDYEARFIPAPKKADGSLRQVGG